MTKLALHVQDDFLAPSFLLGDLIVVDVDCDINIQFIITQIREKRVYLAPAHASQHSPVMGTLISHHRYF